jgi:uncharacterized protein YdgA (DUF945 family)
MQTKKVVVLATSVVVLGWVLVVPGLVGVRSEEKIRQDIDKLQQSTLLPLTVKVDAYDRGWFSSSARVSYSLPLAGQVLRFAVDYQVNQFAIPFLRWARTDYTITPLNANGVASGAALALEAYSIKTFLGRIDTTLKATDLQWNSADGNAVGMRNLLANISTEEGKPLQYKLSLAAISVRSPLPAGAGSELQLVANNLQAEGHSAQATTAKDNWQMDSQQKLEALEVSLDKTSLARLNGLGFDATIQDKGSTVDMTYHSRAEKGQFGPINHALAVKEVSIDFSYLNINKQGYADWQHKINQFYASAGGVSNPALEQAAGEAMLKSASSLLVSSPAIRIDQFGFQTDKGGLHSSMELRFDGNGMPAGELAVQNIQSLLHERLSGKANLQLDRALLSDLVAQMSGTAANAQSAQMLEAGIHSAVQQGWLSDKGQRLSADFSFNRDGASLNGHPLPAMAGLLGTETPAEAPAAPLAPEPAPAETPASTPTE